MELLMKTCPKCGAENKQKATECRLCASSLEQAAASAAGEHGSIMPLETAAPGQPSSMYATHAICSVCKSVNEPEWAFCMQCGTKLPRRAIQKEGPPTAEAPSPFSEAAAQPPSAPATPAAPDRGSDEGVVCKKCGARNTSTGFYCSSCGELLSLPPPERKAVSEKRPVLQLITEGGQVGEIHSLERSETFVGRVDGDLIFPHDGYMSSRHARIVERNGRFYLIDQNSRNGTFIRIKEEVELKPGDMFLVGKQLFRFEG